MSAASIGQTLFFTRTLVKWSQGNPRQLAWKGEKDPYRIWLSEIIMQQTRAEQGSPYYLAFTRRYPTLADLAQADDEEVFRLLQGLGYYNRCRNMLETARILMKEYGGKLPASYEELLSFKGIGPYTAAAIASLAFDLPHAVVDGNVIRVLSRFFGLRLNPGKTESKTYLSELAQKVMDLSDPAKYNQAIMDFGATVCKPAQPACTSCPLAEQCTALACGTVEELPLKIRKPPAIIRHFCYLLLFSHGDTWIRKRIGKDIWQNLYEFYLIETSEVSEPENVLAPGSLPTGLAPEALKLLQISLPYVHKLSHQTIVAQFIQLELTCNPEFGPEWIRVPFKDLDSFAMPRLITRYLHDNQGSFGL